MGEQDINSTENINEVEKGDLSSENKEKQEVIEEQNSLEEQLSVEKDKYLRLYAEFENFKKRTSKDRIELFQYASQDLITSLLPVLDDFERAIVQLEKIEKKEEVKGIELIQQKLFNTLKDKGLSKIELKAGDDFNVELAEAITQIPAPTDEMKGKIVDIIETGYKLHDRIIRYTKVVTGE